MKIHFNKNDNNVNIYKLLLKSSKVNYYTKLLIILNSLNYYEDYYIPNKKLMKMLGIDKKNVIRLLKQLEEEKIIYIYYKDKNRKRYFNFRISSNEKEKENKDIEQLFDYNWLEEEN